MEGKIIKDFRGYCEKCHKIFLTKKICPICKSKLINLKELVKEAKLPKNIVTATIIGGTSGFYNLRLEGNKETIGHMLSPEEYKKWHISYVPGWKLKGNKVLFDNSIKRILMVGDFPLPKKSKEKNKDE